MKPEKPASLPFRFASLLREEKGVSMLEFGLLLPILVLILVGSLEVARMVLFHQKVDNATYRVADMVTRSNADTFSCTGVGGAEWMRDTVLKESLEPYEMYPDTGLIISAVEAGYQDPLRPNDNVVLNQNIIWQWRSGPEASLYGTRGANLRGNDNWPNVFRRSPNAGGMYNRDRIITVEVFYRYKPLLDVSANFLPFVKEQVVYKTAYYRARYGNLGTLGCAG